MDCWTASTAALSIIGPITVSRSSGFPICRLLYAASNFSRIVAATDSCAMTRRVEVQRCPAVPTAPKKNRLRRHVDVGARRDNQCIVAAKFEDRPAKSPVNCFGDVESHVGRASSRHQWNPRIVSQFLADRLAVAHEQSKNCRIGAGLATNALGNFRHGNRSERRFFRSFPDRRVATDGGESGVPRPDRHWKIEGGDNRDYAEWVPLLHQTVAGPFRLNRQAIKHARLTDGEVADVDHLL